MAIRQDILDGLSQKDRTAVEGVLNNPLIWAETTFPAKLGIRKFKDDKGVEQKRRVLISGWRTRPWQMEVLETPGMRKVVRVSRRAGKCQPLDAIIHTPTGPRLMGEMKIGTEVCTPNGKTAKVAGVFPQGIKDIYQITFSDGATTQASAEHLWEISVAGKVEVVQTQWIIDNLEKIRLQNQAISIRLTRPVAYSKKDLALDPYFLGVILGDGSISSTGTIRVTSADPEIIGHIKDSLHPNYEVVYAGSYDYRLRCKQSIKGIRAIKGKLGSGRSVNHYSNIMCELGLAGSKSWTKHIPSDYLLGNVEQRLALLQGLMDTDGTIDKKGKLEYYTTSFALAKDVTQLIQSLGGSVWNRTKEPTYRYLGERKVGRTCYILSFQLPAGIIPFRLTRKAERIRSTGRFYKRYVQSVELIAKKETQCIMLDDKDHLYLTDDYIVTHNTAMAIVKCLHKAFVEGRGVIVVAPMEKQVAEIYKEMHKKFMDTRPDLFYKDGDNPTIIQDTRSPYQLQFSNGGFINFITAGTKSGGRADAVRGQGSNVGLIYVDEMDYLSDEDMNSIFAIIGQDESMEMICTSTPTGRRGFFYKLCTSPPAGWKPFHKTCWQAIPDWNEKRDREMKQLLGETGYEHEYLAEFGDEMEGVFNKTTLDDAAKAGEEEYPYMLDAFQKVKTVYPWFGYAQSLPKDPRTRRIVGVDWDKYGAGTQILIVEATLTKMGDAAARDGSLSLIDEPFEFIKVIHRREIPRSNFTLTEAVKVLVAINAEFEPDFYYMDAGYGEYQIETMQMMGMESKDPGDPAFRMQHKVKRINFSQGVDMLDPTTKVMTKMPIKPQMVARLRNKFDAHEMVLNPFDNVLSKQLENYRVDKITQSGQPKYTSVNEHAVDALMLAVWGLYSEYGQRFDASVLAGYVDKPIGTRFLERSAATETVASRYGARPDYFKDGVMESNVEDDVQMAKTGFIRSEKFAAEKHDVVTNQSNMYEQSGYFSRGSGGMTQRRKTF